MTPEDLSIYLLSRCHFDQDTVQDVIVKYLEVGSATIRYPKSWGYRVARNQQTARFRHQGGEDLPLMENLLIDPSPNPEQVAQARESLDRYAAAPTVTRKPHRGKWRIGQPLTRPKKWGFREDYLMLKRSR